MSNSVYLAEAKVCFAASPCACFFSKREIHRHASAEKIIVFKTEDDKQP
ncbi:hypothetical protein [Moritella yayanosii]|nr:hypothetical protein [Moritella yayanosii]